MDLPDAEGPLTWERYLTSRHRWANSPEEFRVTEIEREPIKAEKTERQVVFESILSFTERQAELHGENHRPTYADGYRFVAAALEAEIERMEEER